MGDYKPLTCRACGAEIWPRDERWLHMVPFAIVPRVYCGECVRLDMVGPAAIDRLLTARRAMRRAEERAARRTVARSRPGTGA